MATFSENEYDELDFSILRKGGLSLYKRKDLLQQDSEQLSKYGYKLVHFACNTWTSEAEMHESLSEKLSFPPYYGKNLNALNDVMGDLDVPDVGGIALVFDRYDKFVHGAGAASGVAEVVLDIVSRTSHDFLLTGRRFLTLVQSDDPHLSFPSLGGRAPDWNRREWLNSHRGL